MKTLYIFCIVLVITFSTNSAFSQVVMNAPDPGGGTPPPKPPNPTASTNICGPKTLTRSGTPIGVGWYWQTTANGISLDNQGVTFQAQSSGTYYIRAHQASTDLWSTGAGSITVTVNPNPTAPGVPSIQHNCSNAVFTRGTPPAGVTWYWQDTNASGTSISNSSASYPANQSGTYYIRSYSSAGCWGASTSVTFTQTQSPANPPDPILTGGCGTVNLAFSGSPPQFIRWAWQTSPAGTDLSNNSTNYTVSTSGTYYLRAFDLNTQCWSPGAASVSVSVTPVPPTPTPNPTVSITCGLTTLTHNNNPPPGVTWYWQNVDGGTSTTFSQASHVVTTAGTYYLRARTNDMNGCWSAASASVYADISVKPSPPSTPGVPFVREEPGQITLNAVMGANGDEIRWYTQSGTLLSIGSNYSPVIPGSTNFEVACYKYSSNCESTKLNVSAFVAPKPIISHSDLYFVMGKPITLSVPNNTYSTYSWKKNGVEVGTGSTIVLNNAPGSYTVTTTKTGMTGPGSSDAVSLVLVPGYNSITVNSVLKEGVTDAAVILTLPVADRSKIVEYKGGLGNTIQTIVGNASPLQKDIIQPVQYDALGRQLNTYLPYVSTAGDGAYRTLALSSGGYTSSEQYQFYQTAIKIERDTKPFTIEEIESSPFARLTTQTGVGNDWHSANKKVIQEHLLNRATDAVRLWTVNTSGLPVSTTTYGDYQLFVTLTTDENQNRVKVYTDKIGRQILKEVEADATNWLRTYSIYDDFGRLAFTLSPEGTKAGIFTPTQAFLDQWAFQYKYDNLNRLVEYKAPAGGWQYSVYDVLGRPVMTQNADQRSRSEWAFVKYDIYGRPAVTGFKAIPSSTRASIQTSVDGQVNVYELTINNSVGYTLNRTYPTIVESDLISINYYDNYAFLTFTGWNIEAGLNFAFVAELGSTGYESSVKGLPTGAKVKVLSSSTWWLNAVQYYDKYYRPIQVIAENHLGGTDRSTHKYNNLRQLIETRLAHHNQSVTILQKYNYDHANRITKIYQNINSAPTDQLVSQYEYNELGQLVDKKLHNTTGTTFLQSIDYRYNIRGWIASINNSQLNVNSLNNDETTDYFGMEVLYSKSESGLSNTPNYNGNIGGIKWKAVGAVAGVTDQKSYKYTYDKSDRLNSASSQMHNGTAWTKEASAINEAIGYDHNGNVKSLQRNSRKHQLSGLIASYVMEMVDDLTYTYNTTQGNQLTKVEDVIPVATGVGDFKNNSNIATEYTYNTDGSLTADKNKGIDSVHYNILGKVRRIKFTDGRVITYFYDAGGNKLKMKNFQSGTLQLTTDYLGGFVYEDGALKFFGSPDGRVVKNGSAFEYEYAISDHQGNTRLVFTSALPAPVAPQATFEGDASDGAPQYQNIVLSNVVSSVAANHTTGGTKVVRMNQTYKIGPKKSVAVYPGDKIDIEVWEYHEGASGFGLNSTPLTTLITMVSGAFGGVSGAVGESGMIYSGVNSAVTTYLPPGNQGASRPATYLNYILFDKNYKVLDMGWQVAPATTFTKQKLSFSTLNIKEAGYVFVYLSYDNESNNWVYFDDLKITHTKTNILQYNEYYPFGLQTASSWTRENSSNNFLYNEASELNKNSGWYETFFRGYDPTLGRFHQVDPLAHRSMSHTPYNYGYNNPIYYSDPSGARPPEVDRDIEIGGGGSGNPMMYDYSAGNWGGLGNNQYGQYYNGPGSGNHWSDPLRSVAGNFALMSSSTFQASYGIDFNTAAGQAWMGSNFGAHFGGGLGGLTAAMMAASAVNYDAGTFTYEFRGKIYGGTYHTTNGMLTSSATSQVVQAGSGGWVQIGEMMILEINKNDENGPGSDFIFENNSKFGLAISILEPSISGGADDAARLGTFTKGAVNTAKGLGYGLTAVNVGLTAYTITSEVRNRSFNTHSVVNGFVTTIGVGLALTGAAITSPVWGTGLLVGGAVLGVGYGIASVAGFDNWIDNKTNNWGKSLIK